MIPEVASELKLSYQPIAFVRDLVRIGKALRQYVVVGIRQPNNEGLVYQLASLETPDEVLYEVPQWVLGAVSIRSVELD